MEYYALGILGVKNLSYEVKKHWLRPRSFRVIVAVWLLTKNHGFPVSVKALAKLYGVKTFRSDASLYNAVESGYLHKLDGDKQNGIPKQYILSSKGTELMEKYLDQCKQFEERFEAILKERGIIFEPLFRQRYGIQ